MNTSFESIVVNEIHEAREARTARRVMSGRTLLRTILPAVLLLAFAPKAVLGSAVPGPQVPVNTFTAGDQRDPSMAMDAAGNFVVAWTSTGQDGDGDGVFAQRFDADQQPLGTEFHVNTATAGPQFEPAVAMNASGRFVIVWTSEMRDGTGLGLLAQRYAVDGSRVGSEIRVYSATFDARFEPAVSMDSAGNFVVAWSSRFLDGDGLGVFARRYDATGTAQAPPLRVNTTTALDQSQPAVAMAPAGSFVVTWTGTPVMNSQEIYARRYDATGTAQGPEFAVTTSGGEESAIDIDPRGTSSSPGGSITTSSPSSTMPRVR